MRCNHTSDLATTASPLMFSVLKKIHFKAYFSFDFVLKQFSLAMLCPKLLCSQTWLVFSPLNTVPYPRGKPHPHSTAFPYLCHYLPREILLCLRSNAIFLDFLQIPLGVPSPLWGYPHKGSVMLQENQRKTQVMWDMNFYAIIRGSCLRKRTELQSWTQLIWVKISSYCQFSKNIWIMWTYY